MSDAPREIVERWERSGGTWRIRMLTALAAEVELCSCHGEPVDRLWSTDPQFVRYLEARGERS